MHMFFSVVTECYEGTPECSGNRKNRTMPICAPLWALCDHESDCPNGEDESQELCKWPTCPREGMFSCDRKSEVCVEKEHVCDTKWDCPGGDDEDECG